MTGRLATCAKCGQFTVPWGDAIGPALMQQHQATDCRPPVPCGCLAYDPVENAHTEVEHSSCHWIGADVPCGGCDSCVSAQVAYYRRLEREEV